MNPLRQTPQPNGVGPARFPLDPPQPKAEASVGILLGVALAPTQDKTSTGPPHEAPNSLLVRKARLAGRKVVSSVVVRCGNSENPRRDWLRWMMSRVTGEVAGRPGLRRRLNRGIRSVVVQTAGRVVSLSSGMLA